MRKRIYATALAAVMALGTTVFGVVAPAEAGNREKLYRVGTYLGSAATIYALAKGEDTWALVGGGATLLSYSQWKKQVGKRHKREDARRRAYRKYRTNWLRRHKGKRIVRVRR
jgi:hypothetical protein